MVCKQVAHELISIFFLLVVGLNTGVWYLVLSQLMGLLFGTNTKTDTEIYTKKVAPNNKKFCIWSEFWCNSFKSPPLVVVNSPQFFLQDFHHFMGFHSFYRILQKFSKNGENPLKLCKKSCNMGRANWGGGVSENSTPARNRYDFWSRSV